MYKYSFVILFSFSHLLPMSASVAQSNERILQCASCDVHINPSSNNFIVNIATIDISQLSEWIHNAEDLVNTYMASFNNYINSIERSIEMKYQSGLIQKDMTFFQKINIVTDRGKAFKNIQRSWRNKFKSEIEYAQELFINYIRSKQLIENSKNDVSHLDSIARAKHTSNQLKSVRRQTNKIDRIVANIGISIQKIQSMLSALKSNVFSVDARSFNVDDYIELVKELGDDVSPLMKIQRDLANWINSNTYSVSSVQTVQIPSKPTFDSTKYKTYDEILKALKYAKMYIVYTPKTYTELDSMFNYARSLVSDEKERDNLEALIQDIKNNTPDNLVKYFEHLFVDPSNLVPELSRLKVIIVSDLDEGFKQRLTRIYYNLKDFYNETQGIVTETIPTPEEGSQTPPIRQDVAIENLKITDITFARVGEFVVLESNKNIIFQALPGIRAKPKMGQNYPFLGIFKNIESNSDLSETPDFIRNSQQYKDVQEAIFNAYDNLD